MSDPFVVESTVLVLFSLLFLCLWIYPYLCTPQPIPSAYAMHYYATHPHLQHSVMAAALPLPLPLPSTKPPSTKHSADSAPRQIYVSHCQRAGLIISVLQVVLAVDPHGMFDPQNRHLKY
jgi:hypothetical protein